MLPEQEKITVLRKGKLGQYKQLRVGDVYIGECQLCSSRCLCERLANGYTKHFTDADLMELFDAT